MHIGLIGGIGPAATVFYYERIVRAFDAAQQKLELTIAHTSARMLSGNVGAGRAAEQAAEGRTLEEVAETIDAEDISGHLYTKGQPDPDLVIRTSGEQRLGGFLLWQSAHSEFYFCEALWPEFRRVDFLRAIRAYAERERRFGA